MKITEIPNSNKKMKIEAITYSSDTKMEGIPKPLPDTPFFMYLCGKPKSGKTCFLINLLARVSFISKK